MYGETRLSISYSVLAGMMPRSKFSPVPVSYVFRSFASFFAVYVVQCFARGHWFPIYKPQKVF